MTERHRIALHPSTPVCTMMVLLTGSAGKTASALAEALTPEHKVLVASRRPSAEHTHPTVKFDWLDDSTWSNVFDHSQAKEAPISAVYLVFPDLPEAQANGLPFLRLCIKQGVKRFALLSAWENPEGGPLMGGLHADLKALGQKDGIEWAVLRPHFFMGRSWLPLVLKSSLDALQRTSPRRIILTRSDMRARFTPELAKAGSPSSRPETLPPSPRELWWTRNL